MYNHFTSVQSLDDLKAQFRALAKIHHPDAGGDATIMQEINNEYDRLFPIWKERSGVRTAETAQSTRSEFYTANGWKGENYDRHRDLKDVASLVRDYIKKTYPECKFSVRMDRNYNRLSVILMEAPWWPYADKDYKPMWDERFWGDNKFSPEAKKVLADVEATVNSYNFEDIDGMIDYFNVGFWFHGVEISGNFKQVERKTKKSSRTGKGNGSADGNSNGNGSADYDIQQTTHTKTGETIWVVKLTQNLSREEYLAEAEKMKALGGYYSRYVHGFVFKANPSDALLSNGNAIVA